MKMEEFLEWLKANDACEPGYAWTKRQGSVIEFWQNCFRSDWLLWLLYTSGYDKNKLTLLICDIVRKNPVGDGRVVWDLLTDERSRNAIIVAEKYAKSEATIEELRDVIDAAIDAAAAADMYVTAVYYAAIYAARYAAAAAVYYVGRATRCAIDAAKSADSKEEAQQWQSDYIRSKVPWEEVKKLLYNEIHPTVGGNRYDRI